MHENNKKNIIKPSEQTQSSTAEELLSLIQELRSDEQTLRLKVAQQAELIEKLNESDLELKKAEDLKNRLKEKEKHWQNEVKRSQEEVLNAENRANTVILQANSEKEKSANKKSEYDSLINSQKKLIEKKAAELNDHFRIQWQWVMLILFAYSGLTTLFTDFKSERVQSDCIGAFNAVRKVIMIIFSWINNISEKIASYTGIPNVVILIVVAVISFGIIGLIVFFCGKAVLKLYQQYCYDEISLFVASVSIVLLVWFAELMPLNIVLMLILSHIVYIGVRWYIKGYKENH